MKLLLILLSIISFLLSAGAVEAAPIVTLQELLGDPTRYDDRAVTYRGEAIGDILHQQDFAWINVRDENGAIGVFCSQKLAEEIKHTGDYRFRGDMISVRGIFHHACVEHGGDTDIHADGITVIKKGRETAHPLDPKKVRLSIILLAIALGLAIIHQIIRKFR